jgi:anti-anti-sigma factor
MPMGLPPAKLSRAAPSRKMPRYATWIRRARHSATNVRSSPISVTEAGFPGQVCPVRKGDDLVIEVRYLRKMIDGVPVMATPPEIDVTTAEQLRAVLLTATENRYRTLVVDMTRTRFCDSAAVHALIAAHKRVLAEGGELARRSRGRCRPPRLDLARH